MGKLFLGLVFLVSFTTFAKTECSSLGISNPICADVDVNENILLLSMPSTNSANFKPSKENAKFICGRWNAKLVSFKSKKMPVNTRVKKYVSEDGDFEMESALLDGAFKAKVINQLECEF